jgi:hypothetical protein
MCFSDKFQKINLHEILKHTDIEDNIVHEELAEEDVVEAVGYDKINAVKDNNNNLKTDIDMNVFSKHN